MPERGKGPIVTQLQAELGIGPGDSSSDADMFTHVQIGVAVNPSSEQVRAAAHLLLQEPDLRPLLPRLRAMVPGWLPAE